MMTKSPPPRRTQALCDRLLPGVRTSGSTRKFNSIDAAQKEAGHFIANNASRVDSGRRH